MTWLQTTLPLAQADPPPDVGSGEISDWLAAAIVLVGFFAAATAARAAIRRLGHRKDAVSSTVQIMARLVFAALGLVGIYIALRTIGLDLGPALAGAGIVGITLAFALQDIAENYISGVIMGFRNPFAPGDQIISGDSEGTVEELNLRYTTIRTYDGVRVLLPNGHVLKRPLTNLTINGSRRTDFTLGVAYGTDLEQARRIVIEAVVTVDGVDGDPPPQAWVEELAASWISIRVRYWHAPRIGDMWRIRSAAIIAVVEAADRAGIELPFEHRVVEVTRRPVDPAERGNR